MSKEDSAKRYCIGDQEKDIAVVATNLFCLLFVFLKYTSTAFGKTKEPYTPYSRHRHLSQHPHHGFCSDHCHDEWAQCQHSTAAVSPCSPFSCHSVRKY